MIVYQIVHVIIFISYLVLLYKVWNLYRKNY